MDLPRESRNHTSLGPRTRVELSESEVTDTVARLTWDGTVDGCREYLHVLLKKDMFPP